MKQIYSSENLSPELHQKQRLIRVAKGDEPADVVLKNAVYVNVFSNELLHGDIAVAEGIVAGIGDYTGLTEYDMTGKVVAPGFIDAHIHLESSLLSPVEFARAVLPHGTTTVVADPHEIANVCGRKGIDYLLQATEGLPIDVLFMLPSCVPAAPVDENGATLDWEAIDTYYTHPRVLGLAEMMNYPGVTSCEPSVLKKIVRAQAYEKIVDGHAPGLSGAMLNAYTGAGIYSDHECSTTSEALEKLRNGQRVMIREGTAAQNLEELLPLLTPQYAARCMFATDDKHPLDLLEKGHIDHIARKAVRLGADPLLTVRLASYHAAQYFCLQNKGAIAPGYLADFAVLNDLNHFEVCMVFKNGQLICEGHEAHIDQPEVAPELMQAVRNTFCLPSLKAAQLAVDKPLPLIGMIPRQIITDDLGHAEGVDTQRDILKAAVAERHRHTGHIGLAYVKGYGLKSGAIATSIAHDSHNLIAIGTNDEDIALAINHVVAIGGGMAVVNQGKVTAELPLPIAGLMSEMPAREVSDALEALKAQAYQQGANHGIDPFMTLSFMSLPVIPSLRLLTRGAFSVDRWTFIE
ncbi:MAG: adenine deaminase [Christensenellales bacterium]|nr:adenine deaminase [Christensenellales bacterium]